jgi:hypothetical protein
VRVDRRVSAIGRRCQYSSAYVAAALGQEGSKVCVTLKKAMQKDGDFLDVIHKVISYGNQSIGCKAGEKRRTH